MEDQGAEKAASLLNEAHLAEKEEKISKLTQLKHLLLNLEPQLLPTFYRNILEFQLDTNADIRKFVLEFIEETCKLHPNPSFFMDFLKTAQNLLNNESSVVSKKAIMTFTNIYSPIFIHLASVSSSPKELELWRATVNLQNNILKQLESSNDGTRTLVLKLIQKLILAFSVPSPDGGQFDSENEKDISLVMIKEGSPMSRRVLEEDGKSHLKTFLQSFFSESSSSANLTAMITSALPIIRNRPSIAPDVISALVRLYDSPPKSLSASQLKSVHHALKLQLKNLSKAKPEYLPLFKETLDILNGKIDPEKRKSAPAESDRKKRQKAEPEPSYDDFMMEAPIQPPFHPPQPAPSHQPFSGFDVTQLPLPMVVDIVLRSISNSPPQPPPNFHQTWETAKQSLDPRITASPFLMPRLAAYLFPPGRPAMGAPGFQPPMGQQGAPRPRDPRMKDPRMRVRGPEGPESFLPNPPVGQPSLQDPSPFSHPPTAQQSFPPAQPELLESTQGQIFAPFSKPKLKEFVLKGPTDFDEAENLKMIKFAFQRMLESGAMFSTDRMKNIWRGIVSKLASLFNSGAFSEWESFEDEISSKIVDHIMSDPKDKLELGLRWLHELYISGLDNPEGTAKYVKLLLLLMDRLKHRADISEKALVRLVLDSPEITPEILGFMKQCCLEEERLNLGLILLKEIIAQRPPSSDAALSILLDFCIHSNKKVRTSAIQTAMKLHTLHQIEVRIESHSMDMLKKLASDRPPGFDSEGEAAPVDAANPQEPGVSDKATAEGMDVDNLEGQEPEAKTSKWTDDIAICYADLYFALCKIKPGLLDELLRVYVLCGKDVQKSIRNLVFEPAKAIGLSPKMFDLIRNFPPGSEELMIRIIFSVTDKGTNAPKDLVQVVKETYERRELSAQFLIPILLGLSKADIINYLPQLIDLQKNIKMVIGRLVDQTKFNSPISPSELLLQLHFINPAKHNVGYKQILEAMDICFSHTTIFKQEILAAVLQKLVDHNPLPDLLMRTVIISLQLARGLSKFVCDTIFQSLIRNAFWKSKQLWTGFVKCCSMVGAIVVPVLPQLPPKELEAFLIEAPKFRSLLRDYATKRKSSGGLEWKTIFVVLDKLDSASSSSSSSSAPSNPPQQEEI